MIDVQDAEPSGRGPTVFLLNSLGVGGSEAKAVRIANALAGQGWAMHIAYLNGPHTLSREIDGAVSVCCLNRRGPFSLGAARRLGRYVRGIGATAVLAMNLYPCLYSSAVTRWWPAASARNLVAINTTELRSAKERLQMALYARLLRRADNVIFGCRTQLEQWTRQYGLHSAERRVIYNGVDTVRFSPGATRAQAAALGARLGYAADDLVVGTVGRLRREKAQGDLIDALARVSGRRPMGVRGLLIGSGPERASLEDRIRSAGVADRVTLIGELEDVRPALELMDIFVLPSIAVETFSNAALEAMAMGKPVVLSDVGGAHEMVTDETDGRVFPKANVEALTAILLELAANPLRRRALGENARRSVEERFSFNRMVEDYKALLGPDPLPASRVRAREA